MKNEFVSSYMKQGYKQVSQNNEPDYLQTLADVEKDIHVFDSVGDILMLDRDMAMNTIFKDGLSPLQFEHRNFFVDSVVFDVKYSEAYADQYRTQIKQLLELIPQMQVGRKEEYIQDQVYSLLGIRGYAFLSLKKLISNTFKKIDQICSKMIGQHVDILQMQYYKSSKCTLANNLTTSLLMYGIWENYQHTRDVMQI